MTERSNHSLSIESNTGTGAGHRAARAGLVVAGAIAVACALLGCDDEKKAVTTERADGGPRSDEPAIDPNLAKAVASVEMKAKGAPGAMNAAGGPPPTGVFEPGQADKELPPGSDAKITLGSEGSEPRVALTSNVFKAGDKRTATLQLQLSTGPQQQLPPIDFTLTFQAQKSSQGPELVDVTASVTNAVVADTLGVPAEFKSNIGKLKGSRIEYRVTPNGAARDFRHTLAKGASAGLDEIVRSISEAIATLSLPVPDKALGKGAYYMVGTRETNLGMDVLAYRLAKVTEQTGDTVTLTVSTKRYAASDKFQMPNIPPELGKLTLKQFQSTADGTLQLTKGAPLPVQAELAQELNAGVSAEKQPGQTLGVQGQSKVTFKLSGAGATVQKK